MPKLTKNEKSPSRKTGTPDDLTSPKFRNKILGFSVAGDNNNGNTPNFAVFNGRREDLPGDMNQETKDYITQLEQELARRQESYIRRERQYKVRISELEAHRDDVHTKKTTENIATLDTTMDKLRHLHRSIIDSVDQVQDRTSKILQEQEKDLLRAFRARLYSVQEELESEKNKTDDGASAWIEKSKQLENEVEWTKELADRLDRLNQSLTRENQRLKTQFTTQENDREFLVKQLVTVKKDNVRLRSEYESMKQQLEEIKDERERLRISVGSSGAASMSVLPKVGSPQSGVRPTTSGGLGTASTEPDSRYKEIIKRLKRLLDVERRNLQHVRNAHRTELQNRTELEEILKECIQDVRVEIAQASTLSPSGSIGSVRRLESPSSPILDQPRLSAVERQRVIEKLLEKERVLNLLSTKAFPILRDRHEGVEKNSSILLGPGDVAATDCTVTLPDDSKYI